MRTAAAQSRPAPALFASSFAGQAGLLVLTPVLIEVAEDFDVTTATAGQSRAVAGLAGAITALALARAVGRHRLRTLLQGGLTLLLVGSLTTATAPAFYVLLAAQLAVGAGIALVLSASLAAASEWPDPRDRARVVTLTIVGPSVAWIVGMPLVGALAAYGWRAGLIVPLASAAVALALVSIYSGAGESTHVRGRGVVDEPGVLAWAAAELLSSAGWAGASIYSGALLVESYGASPATAALLLAVTSLAYPPAAFLAKRWLDGGWRGPLIGCSIALAVLTTVTFTLRVGPIFTSAAIAGLVFLGGGRATAGAAYGMSASPAHKLGIASIRAAAAQFGYLLGATAGGIGLQLWGYDGVGGLMAAMFAMSAALHGRAACATRPRRIGLRQLEPLRCRA
jgi:predicted MFS family arabinose efflux permease